MKSVRYPGPAATLALTGHTDDKGQPAPVARGDTIDVDDTLAEHLVDQGWEPVGWEPPKEETPVELTDEQLLEGSADDVIARVGDDPALVAQATRAEKARKAKARKSLIERLSAIDNQEG